VAALSWKQSEYRCIGFGAERADGLARHEAVLCHDCRRAMGSKRSSFRCGDQNEPDASSAGWKGCAPERKQSGSAEGRRDVGRFERSAAALTGRLLPRLAQRLENPSHDGPELLSRRALAVVVRGEGYPFRTMRSGARRWSRQLCRGSSVASQEPQAPRRADRARSAARRRASV
jgi:hypothetical protein